MYKVLKRTIDLLISGVTFILLSPLFLIIVILLRCTAEGHVFYFQERIGYKNEPFDIWKFATMLKNSPNMGTGMITLRNDPRVTSVGKYLRKSKLNEMPQIINVMKGDMSIVGPRPLVTKTYMAIPEDIREQVYMSKPGVTGVGSIVFRDEELLLSNTTEPPQEFYNKYIAPYKGALEIWYLNNKSLWVDIKIIFLTAWTILFPKSNLVYQLLKDLPQPPEGLQPIK